MEQHPSNASLQRPLNATGPNVLNASTPDYSNKGYRDLDLLRRDGFAGAEQASVSVRIVDHAGQTPAGLAASDFTLIVNGTQRELRLRSPGETTTRVEPVVLLVFPPNEPFVHHLAAMEAEQYFAQQPNELLPWKVGIFDVNKKLIPFTNGRSQLLAYLGVVDHTISPFVYWFDRSWQTSAEEAISVMERYEGPKVILAMNPMRQLNHTPELEGMLSHIGPESLIEDAQHIGAHIYVANVGGPQVIVPGGVAAQDQVAQVNPRGGSGPLLGSAPSTNMQVDPRQSNALGDIAYSNSLMMQSAANTMGGFSNSIKDLAAQIHHDLDGNYSLDFDLTPADRDRGIPAVEVRLARRAMKISVLDVVPVGVAPGADPDLDPKRLAALVDQATKHPVSSPNLRITQHVDYFPLRDGLEPVLPMSCVVEWTGAGRGPSQLFAIETVEDENLSAMVLQREIKVRWNGKSLSWERDGQLRPGRYVWRIAVHDGNGNILASSTEKVGVGFPKHHPVAVSSLVLGKSCEEGKPPMSGLQHRAANGGKKLDSVNPQIDPMRAADCRVRPESTERFAASDTLHAFVRIYPVERLGGHSAEKWKARFVLRSESGSVEAEKELPFIVDSGSGYLASVQMPLSDPTITPGPHTLDVEMLGPGIHKDLKESRSISIQPASSGANSQAIRP